MKKFSLEFVILISGGVVMIFELVGSRMLAPYLGTSLPVWTSLIGIVLGSLSLGYYYGGKLADKNPRRGTLALILVMAALLIGLTAVSKTYVLSSVYYYINDIRVGSVVATLILFSPASVFLGMVSPYAVRLKLKDLATSGNVIGRLYAISTLGSILGTFLAGFLLVPLMGSTMILYLLMFLLLLAAIVLYPSGLLIYKKRNLSLLVLFFAFYSFNLAEAKLNSSRFVEKETLYNSVRLFEAKDPKTGRPIRAMTTDPHGVQGAVFLDDDNDLVFDYLKYYRLAEHFFPDPGRALFVGGGVYSFPKDFVKRHERAVLDVVEIDPGITDLARKYFNFTDHDRINVVHEDGRTYLNRTKEKYDIVYLDAFNSHISIPFQMTTKEAVGKIYNMLNSDGIAMANIISAIDGEKGKFLRAEIATFKEYFDQVYIFPIDEKKPITDNGNIMLLALRSTETPVFTSKDAELNKYLANRWTDAVDNDMPFLTDDHAPVDFYTMEFFGN